MKLDQLRNIIREEVRSAVKEELQEVMNEAVKAASKPSRTFSAPTEAIQVKKQVPTSTNPIMEMLEQTKATMTNEEYKNVYAGTSDMVQKPNFATSMANQMGMTHPSGNAPGLDISQFDFVKKAGAIYSKSIDKDKEKHGVA
jgi:hypothetical protein